MPTAAPVDREAALQAIRAGRRQQELAGWECRRCPALASLRA